jgi:hypothetical protein
MLAEVEVRMPTVFKGIGKSDISSLISEAIVFFVNSATPDIPLWQFARRFEGDADKFTLDRMLKTLESMNYITITTHPHSDTILHRVG